MFELVSLCSCVRWYKLRLNQCKAVYKQSRKLCCNNPEDTSSNSRAGGKKHHKYSSPPADPSVKQVPGLVLGRQSRFIGCGPGRSMWAHVHTSCCEHSWMLLQDACSQASGDTIMLAPALEPA